MKELTLKQLIVKIKRRKKIIASSASGEMADILLKSSPEVKKLATRLSKGEITAQEFQEVISGVTPEYFKDKPVKMRLENVEMIKIKGDKGDTGFTPVKGKDYFDGKDGYTPVKNKDYFDGKDGYTPVKNKDYFDGKDGKDGRDGLGITGLKGDKGDKPKHKWGGTILTFENPDGTWGEGVELGVKVKEKGSSRRYTPAIIGGLNPAQVDARIRNIGLGNIVTRDHDLLTGLTDDDHTQYVLLTGRSGGQTIIGGTGTTDDLTLQTTSGVGAAGADMHFLVGNNGATEAMTILNNGNVGIGTANPENKLHVVNSGAITQVTLGSNVAGGGSAIQLRNDAGAKNWQIGTGLTVVGGKIEFIPSTVAEGTTFTTPVMVIEKTGNLGIGTSVPTNLLSLGGNSARIFWTERGTVANTAGYNLTVRVGGATAASMDKNGGQLILAGGISTGTGTSSVLLQTCPAGSTGTTDNTLGTMLEITGNKFSVFGVTAVVRATALTAADASALNTGDATSDTVIANMRTRIGELEAKLTAYGLLT